MLRDRESRAVVHDLFGAVENVLHLEVDGRVVPRWPTYRTMRLDQPCR
jgi:hypothetical protein